MRAADRQLLKTLRNVADPPEALPDPLAQTVPIGTVDGVFTHI